MLRYQLWVCELAAQRGLPGEYFSTKPFQNSDTRQDYTDSFKESPKFYNFRTVLGQDVPQTSLLAYMTFFILPFLKPSSSFKAYLQSLTGWETNNMKGLAHGICRKESCQDRTLQP